jgi:hypothetical protein
MLAEQRSADVGDLSVFGLLGATVGVAGGALIGYHLWGNWACCNESSEIRGMFVGAAIGSALLTPTAVHLGNRRSGRLEPSILASTGISLLGLATLYAASALDSAPLGWAAGVGMPLAQIATSIKIELKTSARPN